MGAREEILSRLRGKVREVEPAPVWRSRRQFDELSEQFAAALTAAKGEVRRAADLEGALAEVTTLLKEIEVRTAVVDAQQPLTDIDLTGRWPEVDWFMVGQTAERASDLRAFCSSADLGVSVADAALAETGTVVVSTGPGRSRLTSLLPPVHVALVPTSRLTTDIFTWTAGRQGLLPASVTLISGPSKTADIEQTMATGVHGPKRFVAVLYED